jgi:hypothetical protein
VAQRPGGTSIALIPPEWGDAIMERQWMMAALVLGVLLAGPARAQINGLPLWNEPVGSGSLTFSGDVGAASDADGPPTWAGRAQAGFGSLSVGAALGVTDPGDNEIGRFGTTAAWRFLGGGVAPLAMNVQGGYASDELDTGHRSRYSAAVGLSLSAGVPGFRIEPWISPGVRISRTTELGRPRGHVTRFGMAAGVSATMGLFGIHLGADHESNGDTIYGAGLHMRLNAPFIGS